MLNNRLHIILFILIFLLSLLDLEANSNTDKSLENSTPTTEYSSVETKEKKDKRAARLLKKVERQQKKEQRLPRKQIKKNIRTGVYDELSYNQYQQELPVKMPQKEELEKMLREVLSSQTSEFAIGGGADSLDDVGGILDDELAMIRKGRAVIAKIKELNNFVQLLTGQNMIELPVGISKTIGNETYTVGIANIAIHPTHAQLEIFMEIESPKLDSALMFYSPNVKFTNAGAFEGDVGLGLLGDFVVHIAKKKSAIVFRRGISNADGMFTSGTYAYFGCDGFQELSVDARVYFSRDWLLPVSGDSINVDSTSRVTGDFQVVVGSLDDIIATIDFSPFFITKLKDVRWDLDPMVFDFSDTRSAPQVMFPDDYSSINPIAGDDMWKGFYTNQFKVYLPRKLKKKPNDSDPGNTNPDNSNNSTDDDNSTSIVVHGENIIIDNLGFTGKISTYDVIELKEGNLDGWAFSLDTISLDVMANQLREFNFSGKIHVPLLKDKENKTDSIGVNDCLAYNATITYDSKFNFEVSALGNFAADVWKAEVTILEGSTLVITNDDDDYEGEFLVEATLHGEILVAGEEGFTKGLRVEGVSFQNLVVRNQKRYIEPGNWGFPSVTVKMGAFQLTLEDIAFMNYGEEEDDETALTFDGLVSLAPSDDAGITACGSFAFIGNMVEEEERQRWKYDRMKIDEIFINASAPGFGISGGLTFYENHETFGNGFRGMISVWVAGVNEEEGMEEQGSNHQVSCFGSVPDEVDFGISAMAQFGSVEINNVIEDYFFVDLQAKFGATGIPIVPSVLKLTALGGGIYHKMDRDENYLEALVNATENTPTAIPALGTSLSGIRYEPDANVGLGIRLSAGFATMKDAMLNGNVFFEMQFNDGGGLNFILIQGTAQMLKDINLGKLPKIAQDTSLIKAPDVDASIRAYVSILFDFENDLFDAQFRMYLTTPGNIVTGAGTGNVMGWAHIYADETGWFVKIGEPDNRCGVKVNIGDFLAIHFDAYFCVGNMEIPDIPDPPDDVLSLMGYNEGDAYDPKRSSLVSTGAGLAFGASFGVNTGDLTFLIFYGNFQMILGFDISILDYGEAYCVNTNEQIGFDGWYATGQIYAGVGAEVGVTAKIFGKRIKATILQASAGVILQASLPNPFYGRGILGGTYDVLGGLVKGTWRFEIELGEQCTIAGASNPAIIPIIDRIIPEDGAEVGVDFEPIVQFLVPIEDQYTLTGLDGEDEYYKVKLIDSETGLYLDGEKIFGMKELSSDKRSMVWKPRDMLRGDREYMFIVEVRFQERQGYSWVDVYEDGELAFERDTIFVTTGPSLLILPNANIKSSYPFPEQFNFYEEQKSNREGSIYLVKGQADFFEHLDDDVSFKIKLKARENDFAWYFEPNINMDKNILWNFPEGLFEREKLYSVELVYIDDNTLSKGTDHADYIELAEEQLGEYAYYFDPNPVAQQHHTLEHSSEDGSGPNPSGTSTTNTGPTEMPTTVNPNNGEGTYTPPPPLQYKSMYKVFFRTSKYLKLSDKLAAMVQEDKGTILGKNLFTSYKLDEPFGVHEIQKFTIERSDNSTWYQNTIKKKFYDVLQCVKTQYGDPGVHMHEWKETLAKAWTIEQSSTADGRGSSSKLDKLKITSYAFNHNNIPEYEEAFGIFEYTAPYKIHRDIVTVTNFIAGKHDDIYGEGGPFHEPLPPGTTIEQYMEQGFRSCWRDKYKTFLYYYNSGELPPPGDSSPPFFAKAFNTRPNNGTYQLKFKYLFYNTYTVNIVTP